MSIYDPEIDPTIREEEEEAQRLLEQERLKEEQRRELREMLNEVLDEREALKRGETTTPAPKQPAEQTKKNTAPKPRKNSTAKAIFSGGFLTNPEMRKLYPYVFGGCVLLIIYMMTWFGSQRQQHTNQVLNRQLNKIRTEAIVLSSEAKQMSSRSAIAEQIAKYKPELKEATKPVKVIEKKDGQR